jgi:hypothetical protein
VDDDARITVAGVDVSLHWLSTTIATTIADQVTTQLMKDGWENANLADYPVAPGLDELEGPEYPFVIASGKHVPAGTVCGVPLHSLGITEAYDVAHLDAEDFFARGGPVCLSHDYRWVIGKTTLLRYDPVKDQLIATMRFATHSIARMVHDRLASGCVDGASIGALVALADHEFVCPDHIVVHRPRLIEWSIVHRPRNNEARRIRSQRRERP